MRILIVGGGPCGLGAATRLTEDYYNSGGGEKKVEWVLVEAGERVGGLAKSYRDSEGFTWDLGGHVLFSHYPYFDEALRTKGPAQMRSNKRFCHIFMKGVSVKVNYPFQNNLHELEEPERTMCLEGLLRAYVRAKTVEKPVGFQSLTSWSEYVMGKPIVELFFRPYNEKVWSYPIDEMSASWVGERVAVPDFPEILERFIKGQSKASWGPNAEFQYPVHGGIGGIWEAMSRHIPAQNLRLNNGPVKLDLGKKTATLKDGETFQYDFLISTTNLKELIASQEELAGLRGPAKQLKYNSLTTFGVGVQGPMPALLDQVCWAYFPDPDCPFYRCTVLSKYSPNMCPKAEPGNSKSCYYSLLLESTYSDLRPRKYANDSSHAEAIVKYISELGFVDSNINKVVSVWTHSVKYAYPIPSIGRDEALNHIQETLYKDFSLLSRGRFGGWKYEVGNMDHSFMQGVEAVNHILAAAPETTYQCRKV